MSALSTQTLPLISDKPPQSVLAVAEREKKRKYIAAYESRHCSFTPLCLTIDGLVGIEMKTFLQRLAERLSLPFGNYTTA